MCAQPVICEVYRTAIPMRSFEHAAASRDKAEAVVVRIGFDDGTEGWGETLPRPYVTGETVEGVIRDIAETVWPACFGPKGTEGAANSANIANRTEAEARRREAAANIANAANRTGAADCPDVARALPARDAAGRCINAAACAVELALGGGPTAVGVPGVRVSGVLGSSDGARTARQLKRMLWYGLRDFKLKLGLGEQADAENLRIVHDRLGGAIARGRCTLRVDVNGGWGRDETPGRVEALKPLGVCVVEQPVFCAAAELAELAGRCALPLMADESLLTADDARALLPARGRVWWNIRLSKNGGLGRSRALAELAAAHEIPFTVGCMVGESSILSAAQRKLLRSCPPPRFVEGNYGRFLLADDLTNRSLRFCYGGRLRRPLPGCLRVHRRKLGLYGRLEAVLTPPAA